MKWNWKQNLMVKKERNTLIYFMDSDNLISIKLPQISFMLTLLGA